MTFFVILSGLAIFSFVNYVFCISRKQRTCRMEISNLSAGYGILGLTTILLLIYVNYHYIMDFSAAYGFGGDFFEAMVQYKIITTLKDADAILVPSPWYRGFFITIGFEKGIVASSSLLSLFCSYSKIFYSKTFLLPFFSDFIPEENYSPFIQNDFSIQNAKNF